MAIKASTGLAAKLMVTGSAKATFDGGLIKVYSGAAPSTADAAVTGDLLWIISVDGLGTVLTFDATAVITANNAAMKKPDAAVWGGAILMNGIAGYWRLVATGDTGVLSTTQARIQGTCGSTAGADLYMSNTTLTVDANVLAKTLSSFSVALPLS
jgi:hypothetical protein